MKKSVQISVVAACMIFGLATLFFSPLSGAECITLAGSSLTLAFAAGAVTLGATVESGLLANIRRWHGSIDDQFAAIDNLVSTIDGHSPSWPIPSDLQIQLNSNRSQLQELINKCRSVTASQVDRQLRNSLLKSTVGLCLLHVKIWAYSEYEAGVMTADDVHQLGFLLPGETGGHHSRTEATDVKAEVKVTVLNEDAIRVVIDQSAGENAAQVVHGWPHGVKNALIVIYASDGTTEVLRQTTTHLHNDLRMPEGSRGKQFVVKAAFLKHVDDAPLFGNQPTFSMPLNTADLLATLDRQHHEDFEAQMREVERYRQEVERLHAELKVKS